MASGYGGIKMMRIDIAVAYINASLDSRILFAQRGFLFGCVKFDLNPLFFISEERPFFDKMLIETRKVCKKTGSQWMFWINSDCQIIKDPRLYLKKEICYGFHRTDIPSGPDGRYCLGVDMYAIPVKIWDDFLSKDIPSMYTGASHIDWWITRACQKYNVYEGIKDDVMLHPLHMPNRSGYHHDYNIKNYFEWEKRNLNG